MPTLLDVPACACIRFAIFFSLVLDIRVWAHFLPLASSLASPSPLLISIDLSTADSRFAQAHFRPRRLPPSFPNQEQEKRTGTAIDHCQLDQLSLFCTKTSIQDEAAATYFARWSPGLCPGWQERMGNRHCCWHRGLEHCLDDRYVQLIVISISTFG